MRFLHPARRSCGVFLLILNIQLLAPDSRIQSPNKEATESSPEPWIADWNGFLARVRQKALEYTSELPNFVCTQTVRRIATFGSNDRRVLDDIVAEVTFFEKKERHKILSVGSKPQPDGVDETSLGMSSVGEFGSSLGLLFDPGANAAFKFSGVASIRGHKTVCIKFEVPQSTSRNVISTGSTPVKVAYHGRCWVEPDSYHVVRLVDAAVKIPRTVPITQCEGLTEYDTVDIAGRQYWLPVSATVRMVAENDGRRGAHGLFRSIAGVPDPPSYYPAKVEARNFITYANYHKFDSSVKVVF